MTKISTPVWKIAATAGGAALTANAVWLNAGYVAHAEGWGSPLVAAGIIVTLCAAVAPPFAERAAKTGQPLKAALLWLFFGLAVAFSLSSSIARSSGYADGKVATAEKVAERARLAQEAYEAAKQAQRAECEKRGPQDAGQPKQPSASPGTRYRRHRLSWLPTRRGTPLRRPERL